MKKYTYFNLILLIFYFSSCNRQGQDGWKSLAQLKEKDFEEEAGKRTDLRHSWLDFPSRDHKGRAKHPWSHQGSLLQKWKTRVHRYNHRETSAERNYSQTTHLWRERLNWYCSWRSVSRNNPKPFTFYQAAEFWRDPLQPGLVRFVWQKTNQTCRSSNMCFSTMFWEWTSSNTWTQKLWTDSLSTMCYFK